MKVRGRLIEDHLTVTEYKAWQRTDHLIDPKTGRPFRSSNFPLIDFQLGQNVASLKSVDTASKSGSWKYDMRNHVDELARTEISVDGKLANKALDIRVQPGGYKGAEFLIAYGKSRGIAVIIKEMNL